MTDIFSALDVPYHSRLVAIAVKLKFRKQPDLKQLQALLPGSRLKRTKHYHSLRYAPSKPRGALLCDSSRFAVLIGIRTIEQAAEWQMILHRMESISGGWQPKSTNVLGCAAIPNGEIVHRAFQVELGHRINVGKFAAYNANRTTYDPLTFPGCKITLKETQRVILFEQGVCTLLESPPGDDFAPLVALFEELITNYSSAESATHGISEQFANLTLGDDVETPEDVTREFEKMQLFSAPDEKTSKTLPEKRAEEYEHWRAVVARERELCEN